MRLLNVDSLTIESGFPNELRTGVKSTLWDTATGSHPNSIPPYAILSHRWGNDEVQFYDFKITDNQVPRTPVEEHAPTMRNGKRGGGATDKEMSLYKIAGACREARGNEGSIRHIWIDTICIDKSDTQEYTTAINSMFRWYAAASICYVYLNDVEWRGKDDAESMRQFTSSAWWSRGWTLQELLAPTNLHFYDASWQYIGSKTALADAVESASGISGKHLNGSDWKSASLAQKLSWLSRRTTTLVEDRAYCMLGVLDIYMEARYGQGENEFLRMQAEIFRNWNALVPFDESLFAWKARGLVHSGLLAPAPGCFRDSGDVVFIPDRAKTRGGEEGITMDPALNIEMNIFKGFPVPMLLHMFTCGLTAWFTYIPAHAAYQDKSEHIVPLNCWRENSDGELRCVSITVHKMADKAWRRVDCENLDLSNIDKLYSKSELTSILATRIKVKDEVKFLD